MEEQSSLSIDEKDALLRMMVRTALLLTFCPHCGGPARGTFYSGARDSNPLPHTHYITIGCLACAWQWRHPIIHLGHEQTGQTEHGETAV